MDASGRPKYIPHNRVAYEATLEKDVHYPGRSYLSPFQEGNKQLYDAINSDPIYKNHMETSYPGIYDKVGPGLKGAYARSKTYPLLT